MPAKFGDPMRTFPALLLLVVGCYDEVEFTADYNQVVCERNFDCYSEDQLSLLSYGSVDECVDYWSDEEAPEIEEGCTFNSSEAQSCIRELESLSCDAFANLEFPQSCYAYITCE